MNAGKNPILRGWSILLVALSLSVGWGIRGNYGHEFGAMFPGCVAAIAACLISGRADWRERVAYFAFFGAVGWGFGGSFSYMQVIGFTHSGHLPSQVYGFLMLFVLGFLWAGIGGAGTALPAVMDRKRLTELFKPIAYVFAVWAVWYVIFPTLETILQQFESADQRHESALYWLDSDWLEVLLALGALLLFDLVDRRGEKWLWLPLFALAGGVAGAVMQAFLRAIGLSEPLWNLLVQTQGDTSRFDPQLLVINWPNFVLLIPGPLGWIAGALAGIGIYFLRYGRFRSGASLFMHMAVGWYVCFLLFPVLLGWRMTPPRGDNWAGVLGILLGANLYFMRNGLASVTLASAACGIVGGIGFSGIAWLKLIMVSFGNPNLLSDPAVVEAWRHYQSANWHSFLEQSYGFVNGIGVAVALGLLVNRAPLVNNEAPRRRWTEIFSVFTCVAVLTYVNMVKNVEDWISPIQGQVVAVPSPLTMPLLKWVTLPTELWFDLFFLMGGAAFLALLWAHARRPFPLLPRSWLGRGELLFLVILWVFVLGNWTKALSHFHEQRLLTEGMVTVNAMAATLILLLKAREDKPTAYGGDCRRLIEPVHAYTSLMRRTAWVGAAIFLLLPLFETFTIRAIYGDAHAGHSGQNYRFGEKANWKVQPLLKGVKHR